MGLKIVFAGTPEFAIPSLETIMDHHQVCAVYTKPGRPSGRGLKLAASPIKQFVIKHYPNLPILQPTNLVDQNIQKELGDFHADIMVVIAYGLILPKAIFSLFKYGCINIHASLLPRWRGAAPIYRALLEGDKQTGVTIMQIEEGLDTGDILKVEHYEIQATDTAQTLHDELARLGAQALLNTLQKIEQGKTESRPQDDSQATYAAKIRKEEALINWHESAIHIDRKIRAFNSWPIAYTDFSGKMLKIWRAKVISQEPIHLLSGTIINANEHGIDVVTGQGIIRLQEVQIPGGRSMPVKEFLHARSELIIPKKTILGKLKC